METYEIYQRRVACHAFHDTVVIHCIMYHNGSRAFGKAVIRRHDVVKVGGAETFHLVAIVSIAGKQGRAAPEIALLKVRAVLNPLQGLAGLGSYLKNELVPAG